MSAVSRDIKLFFEGELEPERLRFDFPLELPRGSDFSRNVVLGMTRIPPGRVATYGELAAFAGHAKAARAAGAVVGANPLPLVIPCHRVVGAGGRLTGYGGGLPLNALLAMEQVILGVERNPLPGIAQCMTTVGQPARSLAIRLLITILTFLIRLYNIKQNGRGVLAWQEEALGRCPFATKF